MKAQNPIAARFCQYLREGGALMLGFDLQHSSTHAASATEITA
jgi:hypothetical protein